MYASFIITHVYSTSSGEFLLMVLGMMNKLADKDIVIASEIFDRLDTDHSGILDKGDLLREAERVKREIGRLEISYQ